MGTVKAVKVEQGCAAGGISIPPASEIVMRNAVIAELIDVETHAVTGIAGAVNLVVLHHRVIGIVRPHAGIGAGSALVRTAYGIVFHQRAVG